MEVFVSRWLKKDYCRISIVKAREFWTHLLVLFLLVRNDNEKQNSTLENGQYRF